MIAVDAKNFLLNIENYIDQMVDKEETVVVTRANQKNLVAMSEDQYNALMAQLYQLKNK